MRTGTCKFGVSCKYHHPKHGGGSAAPVNLNIYGYPLRLGEKECTYYVKTGQCKFGLTCKFHHPQPAGFQVPASATGPGALAAPVPAMYPTLQSPSVQLSQQYVVSRNWPVGRPALLSGSYIPGAYGPMLFPPGMVTIPGWTPYPAPVGLASSSTQLSYGESPGYGIAQLSSSASPYAGQYLPGPSSNNQKEHAYPERPGQPECQHYMRTGDCKYGSSCKYHHPLDWSGPRTNSDGPPFHPNGVSKDGASSKLDHPMGSLSHSPSTSSLTGVPVAPYSVGSSAGTLAPASSSSDLRPEHVSGSSKDATLSTQMPSINSSSGSVGEAFSNSIPSVAHSTVQQHGQSSTLASSSTGNAAQGGEVHPSS
ncbi:hypothetical protein Leryth_006360 [Lithospermum erythrorhizon]|nr:hypothetical protein Leryth_006360 [Lithospermum erythrorhizon]